MFRERPSSVETISGEDDVIEVSMDENSNGKSEKEESSGKESKLESIEKINFLSALGLITTVTCVELQNRRAERKRRSTANPQFVYSSLDVPTVNLLKVSLLYLRSSASFTSDINRTLKHFYRNGKGTRTCNPAMSRKRDKRPRV